MKDEIAPFVAGPTELIKNSAEQTIEAKPTAISWRNVKRGMVSSFL
jgi:hypothetical protein